ncbi:MAG: MarC family protein [Candidatus Algichlamydia australiensis]|nr:MarC family protein [Chlamydiales bacterium]
MEIGPKIISLFAIINIIGNLPIFIGLLARYEIARQRKIILREMSIALGAYFLFGFTGAKALSALGITPAILSIGGGILLVLIGVKMVFPEERDMDMQPTQEPFVFPMAIPCIAGPGSLSAVMIFAEQLDSGALTSLLILIAWIPSLAIALFAPTIKKLLGEKGISAFERIGGLLVTLIAVQMIMNGVFEQIRQAF